MKINQKIGVLLDVIDSSNDIIRFKILEQNPNWRNTETYGSINLFLPTDSNKYCKIISVRVPQVSEIDNTFYIRGSDYNFDNEVVTSSKEFYQKIKRTLAKIETESENIEIY